MTATYPIPPDVITPCAAAPDLFFSDDGERRGNERAALARKVCTRCPWRDPCAAYALPRREHGIWGATTREEREATRKRLGIPVIDPVPLELIRKRAA